MPVNRILCGVLVLGLVLVNVLQAEPASQPASEPSSQPATQASIPADAKAMLDAMAKAYADVKSLSLVGKISLDFDAGREQKQDSTDFTASFVAPNQFRHEVKDDLLVVSTGERV